MNRTILPIGLVAALALPAHADQLARSLDMPERLYSTAELTLMREARQDHDPLILRRTVERAMPGDALPNWNPGAVRPSERSGGAGTLALAERMGVEPDGYTAAGLTALFIDAHD